MRPVFEAVTVTAPTVWPVTVRVAMPLEAVAVPRPVTVPLPAVLAKVTTVLLSAVYGIVDELHQSRVPGRVCSGSDVCTDTISAWLGAAVILAIAWRSAAARRGLPWLLLGSIGCVCLATWGPW